MRQACATAPPLPQIVKGGRPLGALFDDLQDYSAHAIGSVALCQTREAGRTLV